MHELGLCDAILKTVENILQEEHLESANRVVLSIGELSGVIPQFMENCWTAVTYGTKNQNLKLHIETIPGEVQCLDCGQKFQVAINDSLICPHCGSGKLKPIGGTDMTIEQIEVDAEDMDYEEAENNMDETLDDVKIM